jgi:ATP-dependent Lhr-like helicase
LRFLFRGEGSAFLTAQPTEEALAAVSEPARMVWGLLKEQGASYTVDLQAGSALSMAELEVALGELLLAGLVTNDQFSAWRQMVASDAGRAEARGGLHSTLADDLRVWREARAPATVRRPAPGHLRRLRREVTQRLAAESSAATRLAGRWSLVEGPGLWGRPSSIEAASLSRARQLLQRYGVVSRECLRNEDDSWSWGALYPVLQVMELRGEVRRGYFVRGLSGVQFASSEATERLREWSGQNLDEGDDLVLLNACDPANVYSLALDTPVSEATGEDMSTIVGHAFGLSRLPSNYLVLRRGSPILLYEHGASRWTADPEAGEGGLGRAVRLCLQHLTQDGGLCSHPRRVYVSSWNGEPPIGAPVQLFLENLGFRREPPALVWDGL